MSHKEQKFAFTKATQAAGISADTGQNWVRRGHLVMNPNDRETLGRGGARQLSFHTTVQLIIMAELTRDRVPLQDAADAALDFAHFGDETRNPGDLFPKGMTILTYDAGAKALMPKSRILNVTNEVTFRSIFSAAQLNGPSVFRSALFLDVGGLLLLAARPLGMSDDWIRATWE